MTNIEKILLYIRGSWKQEKENHHLWLWYRKLVVQKILHIKKNIENLNRIKKPLALTRLHNHEEYGWHSWCKLCNYFMYTYLLKFSGDIVAEPMSTLSHGFVRRNVCAVCRVHYWILLKYCRYESVEPTQGRQVLDHG